MTTYMFPPADKTLYGLTTGTVYEPDENYPELWRAGTLFTLNGIAQDEPDGVTDVRPAKVGDTISSEEELEALPIGTILRDENGAWEKRNGRFFSVGGEMWFASSSLTYDDDTYTILWLPETRNADS